MIKNTKISIFKSLYKSSDVPYVVELSQALNRIKEGKSKHIIDKIKLLNGNDKSKLKNTLPCIIFSGEFIQRKKSGLKEHSGLMVLDFDKIPNDKMDMMFDQLKQNKHIVSVFMSPSRNGYKAIVSIPKCTAKEHEQYFKQFNKDHLYDYFDAATCNVDRVCFESYDPNIYINYEAAEYNPNLIDEGFNTTERIPTIPINDDFKKIELIMKFNWQKDFIEGERNNFILDIASAFCEYGVQEINAVNYILNNVVYGDFSEDETKNTIKSAYRIRPFAIKYFEDWSKTDSIKKDLKYGKDKVKELHNINDEIYTQISNEADDDDFWFYDKKQNIKIDPLKYKLFLERNGFKKFFFADSLKPSFVKIESNIVSETSVEKIKDFVLNYLLNNNETDVFSYLASYQNLFTDSFLAMLETIELMMLTDDRKKSYIAFQNGILEVTEDNVFLNEYINVNGYIWKNQIIKRDFIESDNLENDYEKFINNISNKEPLSMQCAIGYLLHTYKNKINNKAIILNDEVISDNPEGGTGKGLLVQGLKEIRRVGILDGKSFDDKKSFPYQTISQDTQILVFDDVKKNFDFESKFSLVTEGITLERKGKDAIKLGVEHSPKMLISTNYAIKGEGNSHDRRRHEIEIAQYYNSKLTPFDDFNRTLFDDWDENDYIRFDNYMVNNIQLYLKNGLLKQTNAKNIKLRKFISETSQEFYEWCNYEDNEIVNIRLNKRNTFDQFVNDYQDYKKWLTQKRFNIWIKKYANYISAEYTEGHTNSLRWFQINDDLPF
jgi:hypothetical protein